MQKEHYFKLSAIKFDMTHILLDMLVLIRPLAATMADHVSPIESSGLGQKNWSIMSLSDAIIPPVRLTSGRDKKLLMQK